MTRRVNGYRKRVGKLNTHSKNIVTGDFKVCFIFAKCIFYLDAQKIRTLLFLFELSFQQRNNISGPATRYKIFGVNAHK